MSDAASEHADASSVQPDDTALRVPRPRHSLYVVPTCAGDDRRWRAIRRGPPGDLAEVEIKDATVADLARQDRVERVDVIDTPAWPRIFR